MTAAKRLESLVKAVRQADLSRALGAVWLALAWAGIVLSFDSQALREAALAGAAGAAVALLITRD